MQLPRKKNERRPQPLHRCVSLWIFMDENRSSVLNVNISLFFLLSTHTLHNSTGCRAYKSKLVRKALLLKRRDAMRKKKATNGGIMPFCLYDRGCCIYMYVGMAVWEKNTVFSSRRRPPWKKWSIFGWREHGRPWHGVPYVATKTKYI